MNVFSNVRQFAKKLFEILKRLPETFQSIDLKSNRTYDSLRNAV